MIVCAGLFVWVCLPVIDVSFVLINSTSSIKQRVIIIFSPIVTPIDAFEIKNQRA